MSDRICRKCGKPIIGWAFGSNATGWEHMGCPTEVEHHRGMWNMYCWNGLSPEQQEFLRTEGYLEIGYKPEGSCSNPAELEVTTMWDEFPGPRFYCTMCGIKFLISHLDKAVSQ